MWLSVSPSFEKLLAIDLRAHSIAYDMKEKELISAGENPKDETVNDRKVKDKKDKMPT